jgi:RNA polymerase sigma-70 factor (ECF subfamily)
MLETMTRQTVARDFPQDAALYAATPPPSRTEPVVELNSPREPTEDLQDTLIRAQAGDQQAFEILYRATVGKVHGLCLRMSSNPTIAEECVQLTYIQAWRNLSSFRGGSAIGTWLHRIAVNEVLGLHRKERRHSVERVEDADAHVETIGTFDHADHGLDLEQAIAKLPDQARQVFVLFGIYGYPHQETAEMLNIAVGTSKAHYHRARRQLQTLLGEST